MSNDRIEARISLANLEHNMANMHEHLRRTLNNGSAPKLIAVIKADGYGHGALKIAHHLKDRPYIFGFAVATIEEAMELREGGIELPIIILGYTFPDSYEAIADHDIRPAVFTYEMARLLSETAVKLGKIINIHIKLDTGMGRIGYVPGDDALEEIKRIAALPGLHLEGLFTHLAKADMTDKEPTNKQLEKYLAFRDRLLTEGITFDYCHYLNSAGIIRFPEYGGDLARAGITIYGLWPSEEVERDLVEIYPVMSLISHIAYIKTVPAGTPISYGGTFVTDRNTRIATIPVGYADGYPRALSGKGDILIRGRRAGILGRVCMDQFMVDVTDIPEAVQGDQATLIGRDGKESITFEEWQERTGLLNYELSCHIGKRVPRVYI